MSKTFIRISSTTIGTKGTSSLILRTPGPAMGPMSINIAEKNTWILVRIFDIYRWFYTVTRPLYKMQPFWGAGYRSPTNISSRTSDEKFKNFLPSSTPIRREHPASPHFATALHRALQLWWYLSSKQLFLNLNEAEADKKDYLIIYTYIFMQFIYRRTCKLGHYLKSHKAIRIIFLYTFLIHRLWV